MRIQQELRTSPPREINYYHCAGLRWELSADRYPARQASLLGGGDVRWGRSRRRPRLGRRLFFQNQIERLAETSVAKPWLNQQTTRFRRKTRVVPARWNIARTTGTILSPPLGGWAGSGLAGVATRSQSHARTKLKTCHHADKRRFGHPPSGTAGFRAHPASNKPPLGAPRDQKARSQFPLRQWRSRRAAPTNTNYQAFPQGAIQTLHSGQDSPCQGSSKMFSNKGSPSSLRAGTRLSLRLADNRHRDMRGQPVCLLCVHFAVPKLTPFQPKSTFRKCITGTEEDEKFQTPCLSRHLVPKTIAAKKQSPVGQSNSA